MAPWTSLPEGAYITWDGAGTPRARYAQIRDGYLHVMYVEQVPASAHVVAGHWDGPTFKKDAV